MKQLRFLNEQGDFILENAQEWSGTYFPLANEGGMISSVTPLLAGDCKTGQNTWLLAPASAETLHESRASRNFWLIFDGEVPWSAAGQSALQQTRRYGGDTEEATLTGGLLWQKLTRINRERQLQAEILSFVPAGTDRVEIMQVTLTNRGEESLAFTPVAAIPLYGRSADNIRDHRHVTSLLNRINLAEYGVELHPTLTFDERGHQPGQVTYRVWGSDEKGAPPESFVPLVEDFVGKGSYDWPEAVVCPREEDRLPAGKTAQGREAMAGLFFGSETLEPGERRSWQIVLAVDDDPTPYLSPAAVDNALERTKNWWQSRALILETGDPDFDAWCRWVGIQPVLRRICGCSFLPHHDYGRGGRGWRDLWQDSLALLLADPKKLRGDLLSYFAGVRADGTNATIIGVKPGEFKADRNNIPRVWCDHGFWPLLTVKLYLDETGDDGFLLEEQTYFSDELAYRGEYSREQTARGEITDEPEAKGTVLEHLMIQTVTAFFDVGDHGHLRLRGADWNDGLDMARERGESVAFTAAYSHNLHLLTELVERLEAEGNTELTISAPLAGLLNFPEEDYGNAERMREALISYCGQADGNRSKSRQPAGDLAERLETMALWIQNHIRRTEWVGDGADLHWFNSYYDNSGRQAEGVLGDQIRMMLTGQVFCLLSGTAEEEQAKQIIRAADWYLCDPGRGGYCLNTDFGETKLDMGRMFGFAYGHKENGAVFCHMAVMYAYALYSRGFAAEGYRVLEFLYNQSADFTASHIYPGVPEYFDDRGRGMYPYLTGAGSWMQLTLQTQVFGVRGQAGDLVLEPKLMAEQFTPEGTAEICCHSAGHTLRVQYRNPLKLDWSDYQIGTVVCGEKEWIAESKLVLIPAGELPEEKACLTVNLIPRA